MCVKLVICKDYTEMHGQQNIENGREVVLGAPTPLHLQGATAPCIPGRPYYRHFKTTLDTPYTVVSSGRVIGPTQRPLHDNTQH
jgi:hypothetical protein